METTIQLLSVLVLISQIALAIGVLILLFRYKLLINDLVIAQANKAIFFIALMSTGGSLFFSQIANFAPCELCWFQRIFMYPLVFLFGVAILKKEDKIRAYATPLVFVGWLYAAYHNYIYYEGTMNAVCSINSHVSCIVPYFTKFGFITIPVMSLTAFTLIGFILIICRLNDKMKNKR